MNLILLDPDDFVSNLRVRLTGRRLNHLRKIHRAAVGDQLRVGRIDGPLGLARLLKLDSNGAELEVEWRGEAPAPSPVRLVLALPRPPSLRKVLQQGTALGVKEFVLVHSRRVEKSYWQSTGLEPAALREQLVLGLEQARDTSLPRIERMQCFREWAEDTVPTWTKGGPVLIGHPEADTPCPHAVEGPLTLVIGPEGGFLDHEVEKLRAAGGQLVGLGPRVLRVETATVALLARLAP